MNYPLASPSWDKSEYKAIQDVIDSGKFSMGEFTQKFENSFANYFGSKFAIMVNSGSSANLLAVAALFYLKDNFLSKGDEVIVPAVSWSTTYFPLQQYGLKLKFVDVDLNTLNLNISEVEEAITPKTKLIFAVNLLGNPNYLDRITKICKANKIHLLEDNCESLGAKFNNKYTGTFGIGGTFSTYFSHHISTMEGGVILTDSEEYYHLLLSLRAHGWTRNLPEENLITSKSDNVFYESFRFILPGYNLRPLEIEAAIGIEQLKKAEKFIAQRRKNAEIFIESFRDDERFILQKEVSYSSWFGFSIIINPEIKDFKRNDVVNKLLDNKIETRPIVSGNFIKNEVIKYFDYEIFNVLRNSDIIHENGFFIGNHHYNLEENIGKLKGILNGL